MPFSEDSYFQETFLNLSLSNDTFRAKDFEECVFDNCSFVNCKFEKCKFINCKFNNCVISAINPVDSWFADIEFLKCKVIGCDWTRASQVQGFDFADCQVNYSNFAMLKLQN